MVAYNSCIRISLVGVWLLGCTLRLNMPFSWNDHWPVVCPLSRQKHWMWKGQILMLAWKVLHTIRTSCVQSVRSSRLVQQVPSPSTRFILRRGRRVWPVQQRGRGVEGWGWRGKGAGNLTTSGAGLIHLYKLLDTFHTFADILTVCLLLPFIICLSTYLFIYGFLIIFHYCFLATAN